MARITIDHVAVEVAPGETVLQGADRAGVYIPRLCAHPALCTAGHCKVCAVESSGEVVLACSTPAAEGMSVFTHTSAVAAARTEALNRLLAIHPHACLTCDLREGCSRTECSFNTPEAERCCERFGVCEFQKVARSVGIGDDAPPYVPAALGQKSEKSLYLRDLDLCIACNRCVDACRDLAETAAIALADLGGRTVASPATGETMKAAGCVFCGACVEVCPTGALVAEKNEGARRWRDKTKEKLNLAHPPEPPRDGVLALNAQTLATLPSAEGVYQLLDGAGAVIKIKGVADVRLALEEELREGSATSFLYEEEPMYTSRESQLIQQYLAKHGTMPKADDLDDLF